MHRFRLTRNLSRSAPLCLAAKIFSIIFSISCLAVTTVFVILAVTTVFIIHDVRNNQISELNKQKQEADLYQRARHQTTEEPELLRTHLLVLHYFKECPLCQMMKGLEDFFSVDINAKIATPATKFSALADSTGVSLNSQPNSIVLSSALNLIRSTFLCDNGTSSQLTPQERESCSNSSVRVVYTRFISVSNLNAIIQQFHRTIKVYLFPADPRHQLLELQHLNKEEKETHFQLLCHSMLSDLNTEEEQGMFLPLGFGTIYQEIFLMKPFNIWGRINRDLERAVDKRTEKRRVSTYTIPLLDQYSWIHKKDLSEDIRLVDEKCIEFYQKSIYSEIAALNYSLRYRGSRLPLKTGIVNPQE